LRARVQQTSADNRVCIHAHLLVAMINRDVVTNDPILNCPQTLNKKLAEPRISPSRHLAPKISAMPRSPIFSWRP
jgi:hypothetical protein